jgi:hypothetical protein
VVGERERADVCAVQQYRGKSRRIYSSRRRILHSRTCRHGEVLLMKTCLHFLLEDSLPLLAFLINLVFLCLILISTLYAMRILVYLSHFK